MQLANSVFLIFRETSFSPICRTQYRGMIPSEEIWSENYIFSVPNRLCAGMLMNNVTQNDYEFNPKFPVPVYHNNFSVFRKYNHTYIHPQNVYIYPSYPNRSLPKMMNIWFPWRYSSLTNNYALFVRLVPKKQSDSSIEIMQRVCCIVPIVWIINRDYATCMLHNLYWWFRLLFRD